MRLSMAWSASAIFLATLSFVSNTSVAQEVNASQIRGVDTNKPVAVLQKRFFKKKLRPEVGLMLGKSLDEAYTNTSLTGARIGLFFSEWIGLEVQYLDTSVTESEDRKALELLKFRELDSEDVVSPKPETNPLRGAIDFNMVVAPFYGKSNFFDMFIVYTDLYFTLGASQVDTDQDPTTAILFGMGQRFYITRYFSLRIDFRGRSYEELRAEKKTRKNALAFDAGFSFFFF